MLQAAPFACSLGNPERFTSRGASLGRGCDILVEHVKLYGDRAPATARQVEKKKVNLTKL